MGTITENNIRCSDKWSAQRIIEDQILRYLDKDGKSFIDDEAIRSGLALQKEPGPRQVRDIIAKAMSIETLDLFETAALLNVTDPQMLHEMEEAALKIKKKVYDNRIVTFAPLYLSNLCVNNCLYCGFRCDNNQAGRRRLEVDEVIEETKVLAGDIGHKRLIVVYGEHPSSGVDYMAETISAIYKVKCKTRKGYGSIRRVNVNAAPLQIDELKRLHEVGIGTFQVFQETYDRELYSMVHPSNTIKSNYLWRLYSMHRAMEAGVDDVGIGALFGLGDWRYEVMALVSHALDLEKKFSIGPHTVSFPRLEPAHNTPFTADNTNHVSDDDFRRLVTVIRLAIPHTGMIITARESKDIRDKFIKLGCTQTDASSCIGIGGYAEHDSRQHGEKQQFMLGDTRSLDELIGDLANDGYITSFCTAGYRCGRTGECIMGLLKDGTEGKFCKLNAVITFREWLDDFASEQTRQAGEKVVEKEISEIREQMPSVFENFMDYYNRTEKGERDLYF